MVLKNPPRLALAAATGLAALMLSGCGAGYLAQAARGQFAVMRAREPIDKLLARPDTPDALKQQLLRARQIRDFASKELGLPDNGAYRSYADIGRPYVVWNVVATPEFSVRPRQWCFPIAGCVAYRGYFSEKAAAEFAATLKRKGDDVVVGGVPAYSTLGKIEDPLLNTVMSYGELDLAALVFHELAHQIAYLPGDSSFNEAFATAVEEAGVARYAAHLGDPTLLTRRQQRRRMRMAVTSMLSATRTDLAALYRTRIAPAAMRERKAARLALLAADIRALEQREGRSSGYGDWIQEGLNNAHLAAVATYYDQVPVFERLLHETCGDYLPCLYVEVKKEMAARRAGKAASGGS
jgi:predicted aminopeptidase